MFLLWRGKTMIRLPKWLLMGLAMLLLVALAAPVLADEVKGKVKSITADKREFTVTDNDGKNHEFVLTEDGKVKLGDKDGKLSDLKEGDEVTITYEKKDGKMMVSEIKCKRE
jgi:Cu/Ag efflux protein CusF